MVEPPTDDPNPDDVEELRAENEALRRQLEETHRPSRKRGWRSFVAYLLAVLAIAFVALAIQGVWLNRTVQNEDRFVAALQPLPRNEAIAEALSIQIADGVIEATEVDVWIEGRLSPELAFISAPLADAVRDLIANTAEPLIRSDAVTTAWTGALRATHSATMAVLAGNDSLLVAEEGQVAIDLDEIAQFVVDSLRAEGLEIPQTEVGLGRVVLYESDQLAAAQATLRAIERAGWILLFVAIGLIAAAVWIAPSRRRMASFLGFGTALALLINLAVLRITRNAIMGDIDDSVLREASGATWDTVLSGLISALWGMAILALIVGFVAWAVGPSPRARRFARWVSRTIDRWRRPADETPTGFAGFLREWRRPIQGAVVGAGLLFIILGPALTGMRVVMATVVLLAAIVLIDVVAGPVRQEAEPDGSEVSY